MRKGLLFLALTVLISVSSCSKHGPFLAVKRYFHRHKHRHERKIDPRHVSYSYVLRSTDYDLKYQKAFDYFFDKKYYKALDLFGQLLPYERGRDRGDEVMFYYAMTNFEIGDYVTAAYYFNKCAETYPNSEYASESMFMSAYCYYLISPRWSLDQKLTNEAITDFEIFLTKYPNSNLVDSVNHLIDKLQYKLQKKSYMNAKLYYDLGHYESAAIALRNSLEDYPATPFKQDILYYIALSKYEYADNSITEKQYKRFEDALDAVIDYEDEFPNGKYIKKMNELEKKIRAKLEKLKPRT